LLEKQGKRWDAVPVPRVAISDFKKKHLICFAQKPPKAGA
jgi:hypothetical protein